MKFLIVLVIVSVSVLSVHAEGDFQKVQEECLKEVSLAPEELEYVKKREFIAADKSTVKDAVKCFLECAFKKMELLKENGEINEETLEKALSHWHKGDATKVGELKEKCKAPEGGNGCEKALSLAICMHD